MNLLSWERQKNGVKDATNQFFNCFPLKRLTSIIVSFAKTKVINCNFEELQNLETIKKQVISIKNKQQQIIGSGLLLDSVGHFITFTNQFLNGISQNFDPGLYFCEIANNKESQNTFSCKGKVKDENIVICKMNQPLDLSQINYQNWQLEKPRIGSLGFLIAKTIQNFNFVECGKINEINFNAGKQFGNENDLNFYTLMVQIPNNQTSVYGSPLFNKLGEILGMLLPFPSKLLPQNNLVLPSFYLKDIVQQFYSKSQSSKQNEIISIERTNLGISVKDAVDNNGAFVVRANQQWKKEEKCMPGDLITEINGESIINVAGIMKIIGYSPHNKLMFKMKTSDAKIKEYQFNY